MNLSPDWIHRKLFQSSQISSQSSDSHKDLIEVIRETRGPEQGWIIRTHNYWMTVWHQDSGRVVSQVRDQFQDLEPTKSWFVSRSDFLYPLGGRENFSTQTNYVACACTWLETGHSSTATPLVLESSLARGWCTSAKPCPIRLVLNRRASKTFLSASVPSKSKNKAFFSS